MVAQTGRSGQSRSALPAKLSAPRLADIHPRARLFKFLVVWVQGPAGAGKTTVVAGWLKSKGLPCLWYQVDAGDGDIASFFYYMGQAAAHAAPRHKRPLPLLTTEYLQGWATGWAGADAHGSRGSMPDSHARGRAGYSNSRW